VPVLLIEDRRLTEVAAIPVYLAKRFAVANLSSAGDIEAEAQVISSVSLLARPCIPPAPLSLDYAMEIYALVNARLGRRDWAIGYALPCAGARPSGRNRSGSDRRHP